MGQIIVRGIDDKALARLRTQARRLGKSTEQLVRELIEREADLAAAWARFSRKADQIRERLQRTYGQLETDSTDLIREDRDR